MKHSDNMKKKHFPFAPENKKFDPDDFSGYMKKIEPDAYTQTKKLLFDCSDKKNYLVHYRMLKFYVRHGMVIDKDHEIISFKKSKWMEKFTNFNTQKRNQAVNYFEKEFYKSLNNAFYGKTLKNVHNRCKIKNIKKDDYEKIIKHQSKLIFNGIHKSFESYDN